MENDKNILCHINWFEDNIKITHKNIFSSFMGSNYGTARA